MGEVVETMDNIRPWSVETLDGLWPFKQSDN